MYASHVFHKCVFVDDQKILAVGTTFENSIFLIPEIVLEREVRVFHIIDKV